MYKTKINYYYDKIKEQFTILGPNPNSEKIKFFLP